LIQADARIDLDGLGIAEVSSFP